MPRIDRLDELVSRRGWGDGGCAAGIDRHAAPGRLTSSGSGPIPLVFCLSFVNSILLLLVYGALRAPIPDPDPVRTLLPGVVYDTVLAALVGPLVIAVRDRRVALEPSDR